MSTQQQRFLGKKVVITGGVAGIGRAMAEKFLNEGAEVLVTFRSNTEGAKQLTQWAGERGRVVHCEEIDAQEPSAVERLVARARTSVGIPDIVVHNVATATRTPFLKISSAELYSALLVNFVAPFLLTQHFAREMQSAGKSGVFLNVSSISSFKAISRMAAYQCSKAALSMLTKSAALELASFGIRVNTISPGLTATQGNQDQWRDNPELWRERGKDIPLGRTGLPADHAEAALFLCSEAASWITGADLVVDGGESTI